jgi:two-component system, OmpR family, response regulator
MTLAHTILIVDDDPGLTSLLCTYLARFGFETRTAGNGDEMHEQLAAHRIDLILLDLMLPGTDGLALAHGLRATSRIPIIMLTGRSNAADRVVGLEMGADDYVTKPFEPRELVARIQTVLRRTNPSNAGASNARSPNGGAREAHDDVIRFDGWALDRGERQLTSPKGLLVPLSNAEFKLLSTFLKAPRRVVSRDQLMEQARGREIGALDRSIDLLVSRLRQKLVSEDRTLALIKTVRGSGYMFDAKSVQRGAAPGESTGHQPSHRIAATAKTAGTACT